MKEERNFNTLPSGKELAIYRVANTALYRIAFKSGGQLPENLSGFYTDAYKAQRDIESYIKSREAMAKEAIVKENVDVETTEDYEVVPAAKKKVAKKKTAKTKE